MSKRNISLYFIDILIAANKISRYTQPFKNSLDLLHNEKEWDATIRELQLVGDAISILLKENILNKSYRRIVDFRNQIVHGYFGIDSDIVWDVTQNKIPTLVTTILDEIKAQHIEIIPAIESAIIENKHNNNIIKYLANLKNHISQP